LHDEFLQKGAQAHSRGRVAEAEDAYRVALSHVPTDPVTLHYAGEAAIAQGRSADGIALLEQSIRIEPGYPCVSHIDPCCDSSTVTKDERWNCPTARRATQFIFEHCVGTDFHTHHV
jgi:hypothetical protein